jgi:hypothetical protein
MTGEKELYDEFLKVRRNFRIAGAFAFLMVGVGTVFYHIVEKLDWLDSIYFCVVTLATVGYGDITPKTEAGKLFTIFYILIGIGIIATFANLLLKNATLRREIKKINAKKTTE